MAVEDADKKMSAMQIAVIVCKLLVIIGGLNWAYVAQHMSKSADPSPMPDIIKEAYSMLSEKVSIPVSLTTVQMVVYLAVLLATFVVMWSM